ncbi:MAG TPA: hypothetical protein DCM73_01545 [Clostridiales bacterium]|nr:hypothetical protein [Clostridiales bacterium]
MSNNVLETILFLIKQNGITEKELLKQCNINTSFLTDWKSGRIKNPSYDKLVKIARYFNVSIDYLLNQPQRAPNLNKNMFSPNSKKMDFTSIIMENSLTGPDQCERPKLDLSDNEIELINLFNKLPDDRSKLKFLGKAEMIINEMIEK